MSDRPHPGEVVFVGAGPGAPDLITVRGAQVIGAADIVIWASSLVDTAVVAGANWLLASQQPCGAWGESPETYANPALRGQGPPTASQTAWAVMGLLAAGLDDHPAVARGIQFLVETQQADGTWEEPEFTGTGFPQVFYLRYHYYPIYFPLMALSRWAVTASAPLAEVVSCEPRPVSRADRDHLLAAVSM